jgi:hypothetical protein
MGGAVGSLAGMETQVGGIFEEYGKRAPEYVDMLKKKVDLGFNLGIYRVSDCP